MTKDNAYADTISQTYQKDTYADAQVVDNDGDLNNIHMQMLQSNNLLGDAIMQLTRIADKSFGAVAEKDGSSGIDPTNPGNIGKMLSTLRGQQELFELLFKQISRLQRL